jgi:hypothetical protein
VGRSWRAARLLDDDGGGAEGRPFRGSARCLGSAARDRASFGEQRIYASHKSIIFSRKSCYFFVRPKRRCLEVCIFLGRAVKAPQVRRVDKASKSKIVNLVQIRHRDEVEAPITDWLHEAYRFSDARSRSAAPNRAAPRKRAMKKGKTRTKQKAAKCR